MRHRIPQRPRLYLMCGIGEPHAARQCRKKPVALRHTARPERLTFGRAEIEWQIRSELAAINGMNPETWCECDIAN